jgi:hypothetical protein
LEKARRSRHLLPVVSALACCRHSPTYGRRVRASPALPSGHRSFALMCTTRPQRSG